jgi:hypothetical protein
VRSLHQLAQPVAENMRVDLRRGDVGVPQHLLDAPEVGTVLQEMAGKGMAKHMRRQAFRV